MPQRRHDAVVQAVVADATNHGKHVPASATPCIGHTTRGNRRNVAHRHRQTLKVGRIPWPGRNPETGGHTCPQMPAVAIRSNESHGQVVAVPWSSSLSARKPAIPYRGDYTTLRIDGQFWWRGRKRSRSINRVCKPAFACKARSPRLGGVPCKTVIDINRPRDGDLEQGRRTGAPKVGEYCVACVLGTGY